MESRKGTQPKGIGDIKAFRDRLTDERGVPKGHSAERHWRLNSLSDSFRMTGTGPERALSRKALETWETIRHSNGCGHCPERALSRKALETQAPQWGTIRRSIGCPERALSRKALETQCHRRRSARNPLQSRKGTQPKGIGDKTHVLLNIAS